MVVAVETDQMAATISWVAAVDWDQNDSDVETAIDSDRPTATALDVVAVIDSDLLRLVAMDSDWGSMVNLDRVIVTNWVASFTMGKFRAEGEHNRQ